jgi:hypothetical protein
LNFIAALQLFYYQEFTLLRWDRLEIKLLRKKNYGLENITCKKNVWPKNKMINTKKLASNGL